MQAKKCDRCGKLYEQYEGSEVFEKHGRANAIILIDSDLDNRYWHRKTYDLCPECMAQLVSFISEGKGN